MENDNTYHGQTATQWVGIGDAIVGKCGRCGGLVTMPTIWHSIIPPPKTCAKCGAVADETAHLPVIPMK